MLIRWFKSILRCMELMGGARDNICLSITGPTEPVSIKVGSQIACKIPHFGYPLSTQNGMLNCKERHPLLMKCFKTFLRCIKQMGGASFCIFQTIMGLTEPFSIKVDSRITDKVQDLGILSVWKIGCWAASRDIHSIWIVSKPVLDAEGRLEKALIASVGRLWVLLSYFTAQFTLKLHTKCTVFNILSVSLST